LLPGGRAAATGRRASAQAALRDIPVHPDALPIIVRRAKGKSREAYLFDELPTPPSEIAAQIEADVAEIVARLDAKAKARVAGLMTKESSPPSVVCPAHTPEDDLSDPDYQPP